MTQMFQNVPMTRPPPCSPVRAHQSRYILGGRDDEGSRTGTGGEATSDPTRCSRINEGPLVNIDVTGPGATIALGFMFMKSNNAAVAARLEIPTTHFLLSYVPRMCDPPCTVC